MTVYTPSEPPTEHPDAVRTYTAHDPAGPIGAVALVLATRPTGSTPRRDWWALPPDDDPRPLPRPFTTRADAAAALRYRRATLHPAPKPAQVDHTLEAIRVTRATAGAGPAAWLAAGLAAHHMHELAANRHANPPSLWREIARVTTWLDAATHETT